MDWTPLPADGRTAPGDLAVLGDDRPGLDGVTAGLNALVAAIEAGDPVPPVVLTDVERGRLTRGDADAVPGGA